MEMVGDEAEVCRGGGGEVEDETLPRSLVSVAASRNLGRGAVATGVDPVIARAGARAGRGDSRAREDEYGREAAREGLGLRHSRPVAVVVEVAVPVDLVSSGAPTLPKLDKGVCVLLAESKADRVDGPPRVRLELEGEKSTAAPPGPAGCPRRPARRSRRVEADDQ
jgi:hypothetical protein